MEDITPKQAVATAEGMTLIYRLITVATATVYEAPTSHKVHSMLSATSDVVPSSHFTVREQKVGEAKVTASKPQNHDSNQARGLPHWSS